MARDQNEERAAALAMSVSEWGGARVGVAIRRPRLLYLGPFFLCNRRGPFFCVRRPRKSPRTEARAELHVAGVVRDRSLSRFTQVSRGKSPLAHPRRCSPQPAAARRHARRSPPQPAAARRSPPQPAWRSARSGIYILCKWWRIVLSSTQTTRPYSASCDAIQVLFHKTLLALCE